MVTNQMVNNSLARVLALALMTWVLVLPINSAAATVNTASISVLDSHTQIRIETNPATQAQMMTLENPNRIVLDLINVEINDTLVALKNYDWQRHARIKKIRIYQYQQHTARMVIDLKKPARPVLNASQGAEVSLDIFPAQTFKASNAGADLANKILQPSKEKEVSVGAGIVLDREPVFEPDFGEDVDAM